MLVIAFLHYKIMRDTIVKTCKHDFLVFSFMHISDDGRINLKHALVTCKCLGWAILVNYWIIIKDTFWVKIWWRPQHYVILHLFLIYGLLNSNLVYHIQIDHISIFRPFTLIFLDIYFIIILFLRQSIHC